jgi:hypothetical protein
MKRVLTLTLAALLVASTTIVASATLAAEKSGLQAGQTIGPFEVVKVGGAPNDDVSVGQELCYRCKYGSRPMVMIFTRGADDKLVDLVKQLDASVAKNGAAQLRAFVNVMGDSKAAADATAQQLAAQKLANVPVVVPVEYQNGPSAYSLSPQAQLTVILASDGKVTASHEFETGLSCESCAAEIMVDVNKLVAK